MILENSGRVGGVVVVQVGGLSSACAGDVDRSVVSGFGGVNGDGLGSMSLCVVFELMPVEACEGTSEGMWTRRVERLCDLPLV